MLQFLSFQVVEIDVLGRGGHFLGSIQAKLGLVLQIVLTDQSRRWLKVGERVRPLQRLVAHGRRSRIYLVLFLSFQKRFITSFKRSMRNNFGKAYYSNGGILDLRQEGHWYERLNRLIQLLASFVHLSLVHFADIIDRVLNENENDNLSVKRAFYGLAYLQRIGIQGRLETTRLFAALGCHIVLRVEDFAREMLEKLLQLEQFQVVRVQFALRVQRGQLATYLVVSFDVRVAQGQWQAVIRARVVFDELASERAELVSTMALFPKWNLVHRARSAQRRRTRTNDDLDLFRFFAVHRCSHRLGAFFPFLASFRFHRTRFAFGTQRRKALYHVDHLELLR